jgi:hypothetical protein
MRQIIVPKKIPVAGFVLLALLLASPLLSAQSTEEDLFGSGNAVVAAPADTSKDLATSTFEATKTVVIGGDITIVQSVDLWNGDITQAKGFKTQSLGLNFDARPADSFRVYGRGRYDMANSVMSGAFTVQELFADLSWSRKVSLRVGKQAANWGLGYWWSPADILSLTRIDQSDPTALRSGPVALKASVPIGLGQASAYATAQGAAKPTWSMFAARYEFVLGDSEFGIGGYWKEDDSVAPRLVGTASLGFLGLDWYAEAVASYGSETQVVDFSSGAPDISLPEGLLFQGAAGFSWSEKDKEGRWDLQANGEYYYNGHGAADAPAYASRRAQLLGLVGSGLLDAGSLAGYGRHYAGFAASAEDLWASKLGLDAEWRSNLSEVSGYVRTVAVYEPISDFRLEAGCEAYYGQDGSEYAAMSDGAAATYAVTSLRLWTKSTVDIAYPLFGVNARPRLSFVFSGQF